MKVIYPKQTRTFLDFFLESTVLVTIDMHNLSSNRRGATSFFVLIRSKFIVATDFLFHVFLRYWFLKTK